jgi:hypothetical protein
MIEERFDAKPYDPQVTADDIYNCYRLLLGRTPDEFGWKTKTAIKDRLTIEELVLSFLTSPEFRNGGLFRKMLGQDEALPVPAQCDTFKIYASPDDMAVGRAIHSEGIYEPHVTAIIKKSLKPGMVFVDIGANIGYFSLLAAKLVGPNGLVLAFEPSQGSCTLLQMSAWLNHLSNIEIYPFAAAEQDSSVVFDTLMGSNGSISMALDAENSQLDRRPARRHPGPPRADRCHQDGRRGCRIQSDGWRTGAARETPSNRFLRVFAGVAPRRLWRLG